MTTPPRFRNLRDAAWRLTGLHKLKDLLTLAEKRKIHGLHYAGLSGALLGRRQSAAVHVGLSRLLGLSLEEVASLIDRSLPAPMPARARKTPRA
jgi:hypothetical protein